MPLRLVLLVPDVDGAAGVVVAAGVDLGGATTPLIAVTPVLIFISCSKELNCASSATNCVLSVGFSGSWFFNCVTSSLRKVCSVGATPPICAAALRVDGVLLDVCDAGVM